MDITFFYTSIVFIIFLIVSYYLDVIRHSVPLVIIYFIYCFYFLINIDQSTDNKIVILKDNPSVIPSSKSLTIKKTPNNQKIDTPKPIVSYTPKPIIIDSNIIIQKDFEKELATVVNPHSDSLKRKI